MVAIVIDETGPTKASLIEGAYEYCGLNGAEFERTPEEMTAGLRHLNALMAELDGDGAALGYDYPAYAEGKLEEPSGIPPSAAGAVHILLALRLAAMIGATLSADAKAAGAKAYQGLRSRTAATPPTLSTGAYRLPSSGIRHRGYYISDVTPIT